LGMQVGHVKLWKPIRQPVVLSSRQLNSLIWNLRKDSDWRPKFGIQNMRFDEIKKRVSPDKKVQRSILGPSRLR
jgi:hypothetical protein